jgi:hypothetical protein
MQRVEDTREKGRVESHMNSQPAQAIVQHIVSCVVRNALREAAEGAKCWKWLQIH